MIVTGVLAAFVGAADAATPTVREFGLSAHAQPGGIAAGPDGNLWFTRASSGDINHKIGRITPSGSITEFPIPTAGSGPQDIAAGPDGNVWFTEYFGDRIGRITPAGAITEFVVPTAASGASNIAAGPDGNVWFTEFEGNKIGKITPAGTITDEFPVPTAGSKPSGIAAGPDGNLWFTEFLGNKIGRITPTGTITEFPLPTAGSRPFGITAGPDGNLWFTENLGNRIGRISPSAPHTITEFPLPTAGSGASLITAGPDGNLWFTEFSGHRIGRISPSAPHTITEFPVPNAVNEPNGITAGPDGNMWFTENANASPNERKIARITTALDPPRYTDTARIEVPKSGTTSGPADAYPATIEAAGLQGTVTDVTVRLNGVHHAFAADIEAQIVGPQGQSALLVANATSLQGDLTTPPDVLDGDVLTFTAGATTAPRRLTSGIFSPINPGFALAFTPPAPSSPTPNLQIFDGTSPNGVWKLFVHDDQGDAGTTGAIAGGWSLDIQTTGPDPVQVPGPTQTVPGPTTTVTTPGPTQTVTVTPPPDRTKPTLKLTGPTTRTTQAAFRKGPRFTITPSEPVTLDITLSITPKRATIAAADTLLVYDRTRTATKATTVTAKPSAKHLGRPKKSFAAKLRIVATDNAGNRATVTKTITVTPDRKKRRT